jgi:hypothetical protein
MRSSCLNLKDSAGGEYFSEKLTSLTLPGVSLAERILKKKEASLRRAITVPGLRWCRGPKNVTDKAGLIAD